MLYIKQNNEFIPISTRNTNLFKFCGGCHQYLPVKQFYKNRTTKDGFNNECTECAKKRGKENYRRKCLATR